MKMKMKKRPGISKAKHGSKISPEVDFRKVTAKVDNKAPRLIPENYLKSRNLLADATRVKILDRENLDLIQRINLIHRLGGKVDCSNPVGNVPESKIRAEIKERNEKILKENVKILKGILSIQATYPTAEFLKEWKRIEATIEHTARYPLIWKTPKYQSGFGAPTGEDPDPIGASEARSLCFFDVELSETKESLGRIVFQLYDDLAPISCANFAALCRGQGGLSYKGTPFHRIVPGYWCQGGDVTEFNGTGGVSIYGDKFADENLTLRHAGPGIISMWSSGPDTNDSKFNITFKALPTMDGKRVVFGRLVRGLYNLYKIEELGCRSGKPIKNAVVARCGVLRRKKGTEF